MPEDKPITTLDEKLIDIRNNIQWMWDNLHLPHTSDHYNIPANTIVMVDEIISQSQQKETKPTGLRWVKASEKRSTHYESVCCRIIGENFYFTGYYDNSREKYMPRNASGLLTHDIENIEWLDESGETEETKPVEGLIAIHRVLAILNENYNATKNLTDEDKVRSAQEMVTETYEDLISIFSGKIKNIPANIDSNPMAFYNPVYPKIQTPKPVNNSINFLKWVRDHVTFNDETCKWTDREGDVYTEEELHDLYTLNPTKPVEDNKKH